MKKISIIIALLAALVSCTKDFLYVAPKNIVTDETMMSSKSGMNIWMANMYRQLPIEDFKYSPGYCADGRGGLNFFSWLSCLGVEGVGESLGRDYGSAFTGEDFAYWSDGYVLVRICNNLMEQFPKYKDNFSEAEYNEYIGQAYFGRAYTFFQMARRYGGIPIPTTTVPFSFDNVVEMYRASEEDTWKQILSDFDKAIELLPETSSYTDAVNKYSAMAVKADAAIYAACIAKYNKNTDQNHMSYVGRKSGNRVTGFDLDKEDALSKQWFKEAYIAARTVMKSGKYALYKNKFVSGHDANAQYAQYRNMVDMLSDVSSSENVWLREYGFPKIGHTLDSQSSPYYYRGSGSAMSGQSLITLDFIELFEGFDRYPDGRIKLTTGNSYAEGEYLIWDSPTEFYANAEPRLRSYCIFPMAPFRSDLATIDVRLGVYTGDLPIKPLFESYNYQSAESNRYQKLDIYTGANGVEKQLFMSASITQTEEVEVTEEQAKTLKNIKPYLSADGTKWLIDATALNGPFYNDRETCGTGIYLRKYLDETLTRNDIHDGYSDQPFVLYRYAEVMLTAAEAAIELALAGEPNPMTGDDDMLLVATQAVKDIQERAGVINVLDHNLTGDLKSLYTVRKERRKELALEHKSKWDLRRWRVNHKEQRQLFWGEERDKDGYFPLKDWSLDNSYRFRAILPIYSVKADGYFFDGAFSYISNNSAYNFSYNDYYFTVPGGEVAKSNYIDQQPHKE